LKSLAPNTHKLFGAVVVRLTLGAAEDALLPDIAAPAPMLLLIWYATKPLAPPPLLVADSVKV
jgi:hypothetical protein